MSPFIPPWYLANGFSMTVYTATVAGRIWTKTVPVSTVPYQDYIFTGYGDVPLFGQWAMPSSAKGTIVATYGITGDLADQWLLDVLRCKAYNQGYGVVLFDWRAHGKTAELSPALTSDGIYEGEDYLAVAKQAKALGCQPPFWFVGYSLSGQLVLWAARAAMALTDDDGLAPSDIGGVAAICPSLDSTRSLNYLMGHPLGRWLERSIAHELARLAHRLYQFHPEAIEIEAVRRVKSIWTFDQELVIPTLGFDTVEEYYAASSPLPFLTNLTIPTLILYAADDPLFDPAIVPDLEAACAPNDYIRLLLTQRGGHVGYINSEAGQRLAQDPDPWWAWNRVLQWIEER
jgi:predicted alpha/beta-fold hydrolase